MPSTLQVQVNLKSSDNLLSIGEVARRSGVRASALRFYEERGLIASADEAAREVQVIARAARSESRAAARPASAEQEVST